MKKFMILGLSVAFLSLAVLAMAEDVYVTKQGKKFHTETCPLIQSRDPQKIKREEAVEKGLEPCQKCFKDEVSLGETPKLKSNLTKEVK